MNSRFPFTGTGSNFSQNYNPFASLPSSSNINKLEIDSSLQSFGNSKKHLISPRSLNIIDKDNVVDKDKACSWNINFTP